MADVTQTTILQPSGTQNKKRNPSITSAQQVDVKRAKKAEYNKRYRDKKREEQQTTTALQTLTGTNNVKANTVVSIATKRKAILPNDNEHKRVRKNANNKAYRERKEERLITTALRIETTTDNEQANTAVLIATSERVAEVSGEQLLCNSHAQPVKRNDFATWIDYKRDAS